MTKQIAYNFTFQEKCKNKYVAKSKSSDIKTLNNLINFPKRLLQF